MPSFSTSLSGLNVNSTNLSVIANNLANLNTVGYKDSRGMFQDLFYQQIGNSGSGNPIQVGVGASVAGIGSIFTQGSIETSGVPTDIAIQGEGFLVASKNGLSVYTRAGNLTLDATGQLLTQDGANVQGYMAVNGVINPSQTLGPLSIPAGLNSPPLATANAQLAANLNSDAVVGTGFSTSVAVYDSLGASHVLTYNFTKTAINTWGYSITIPAADLGGVGAPVVVNSGTLGFNGAGQLTSPAVNVTGITIAGFANGANPLTFNWNLYTPLPANAGLLTQVSGPSATSSTQQNGYPAGTLVSFTIGSTGIIQGIFSNGQTIPVGQIALASFSNVQGLLRNGSNNYLASLSSGSPNVGAPGTGGRGTINGGALEQSNVDIASEFAKLIIAQRGYQANAKAVTTFDEVTQEAINLKR
jgi:flagellar hook protein FlgE